MPELVIDLCSQEFRKRFGGAIRSGARSIYMFVSIEPEGKIYHIVM